MRARKSTAGMTDLCSSFLKRQLQEVLNRTMVVPGESGTSVRRKPEEIYDNSFVFNREKSGFLK